MPCTDRFPGLFNEPHGDLEMTCVGNVGSMELDETTGPDRRLPAGHYRETNGHEPEQGRCVKTTRWRTPRVRTDLADARMPPREQLLTSL